MSTQAHCCEPGCGQPVTTAAVSARLLRLHTLLVLALLLCAPIACADSCAPAAPAPDAGELARSICSCAEGSCLCTELGAPQTCWCVLAGAPDARVSDCECARPDIRGHAGAQP